jgi:hypothetical protein
MERGLLHWKTMTILQASFFWRNDKPGGIGVTFGPPSFSPEELARMFDGEVSKDFTKHSDLALGSNIVQDMLTQLTAIGERIARNEPMSPRLAVLAALNIQWLTSRGFIPQDEFNGVQFVTHTRTA